MHTDVQTLFLASASVEGIEGTLFCFSGAGQIFICLISIHMLYSIWWDFISKSLVKFTVVEIT